MCVALLMLCGCHGDNTSDSTTISPDVPHAARVLMAAYPDQHLSYSDGCLWFPDSTAVMVDDGRDKNAVERMDDCDLADMFVLDYDTTVAVPAYQQDCGRARCEAFFKQMYGGDETAVRSNLVPVDWLGDTVLFSRINGAAEHLKAVAADLEQQPQLQRYLKSSGTFCWRTVSGTQRLSAHSYGIAIDIGVDYSDYWQWRNPRASETDTIVYSNHFPLEVVRVFERHGFIWGGRWYHYDTMHFEYRPEYFVGASDKDSVSHAR